MNLIIKGKRIYNPDLNNLSQYGVSESEREDIIVAAKWFDVRALRDKLISDTDWTQIPDAPLSDEKKTEFATYRQSLRDIPQNIGNPDDVIWPEKPTI
ncbi:tail fiber assembly protein [Vibrio diabolicus]|uniref:tail fiber assembly protein n=1 Tax=Vibrio diabolicus TaxID=50719 RepID=UPI00375372E8